MESEGGKKSRTIGKIRIRGVARGLGYPDDKVYTNIPAWSRGASPWNRLSPFTIGPVEPAIDGDPVCSNFESFWQAWKVWKHVDKQTQYNWKHPAEDHLNVKTNLPNEAWYEWHRKLLANPTAVRRPNGRAIPEFAYYCDEKLDVVQARKRIYIPVLQKLYRAHPVYQQLVKMVERGENICILEPDGPSLFYKFPNGIDVDIHTLIRLQDATTCTEAYPGMEVQNGSKYFPYGHGYVLALTILEDLNS